MQAIRTTFECLKELIITIGVFVGTNGFEYKYFVHSLIRKPLPLLVFVKMYHSVLGEVIGINNISVYQICLVNACNVTKSKRPISDWHSEGFPNAARRS